MSDSLFASLEGKKKYEDEKKKTLDIFFLPSENGRVTPTGVHRRRVLRLGARLRL